MPNSKSAERRMHSNLRKQGRNQIVKTRVKTTEKKFIAALATKVPENVEEAYRQVCSALDKASKAGVIHPNKAGRKKSRLAASATTA